MKKFLSLLCFLLFVQFALAGDVSITAASFVPSSAAVYYPANTGKAGASITAGQVVYLDTAGVWQKARANALATTPSGVIRGGLACHAAATGQPLVVLKSDTALALGASSTEGYLLCVSASVAGNIGVAPDLTTLGFPFIFGIVLDGGITASVNFETALYTGSAL